jgi:hypothetical protein
MTRPESSSSALPRRGRPSPVESGQAASGSTRAGRPDQYLEFNTPPDPASQPVALFPALASPTEPRPRAQRRPRIVVSVPMWVVAALALLAIIAGLLFLPSIGPWSRAPVESPLDDGASTGAGVVGPVDPEQASGGPGAVPGAGVNPGGGGTGPSAGPGATASSAGGTASPTSPGTGTTAPGATTPLQLVDFTATTRLGLTGYNVTFKIINASPVAQSWQNASTLVNETLTGAAVTNPEPAGINTYVTNDRVCVAPTDPAVATLDPGEILTVAFRINQLLAQPPAQGQLDDDRCVPAS